MLENNSLLKSDFLLKACVQFAGVAILMKTKVWETHVEKSYFNSEITALEKGRFHFYHVHIR